MRDNRRLHARRSRLSFRPAHYCTIAVSCAPSVNLTTCPLSTESTPTLTLEQVIPGYHTGEATVAGILLDPKTKQPYRLDLLDIKAPKALPWKSACAWAKKLKADVPDRRELNLLRATLRDKFQDAVYWSNEPHAGSLGLAWAQNFFSGGQWYCYTSAKLLAVAVRRVPI